MNKKSPGFKSPPANSRRPKKPTSPPPGKRGLTSDDKFFEARAAEYERGLKDAKTLELPEITEAWTAGKAKEIWDLIKEARDEDLISPVTDRYYLRLALDIVTSIINDLRPKNNMGGATVRVVKK